MGPDRAGRVALARWAVSAEAADERLSPAERGQALSQAFPWALQRTVAATRTVSWHRATDERTMPVARQVVSPRPRADQRSA